MSQLSKLNGLKKFRKRIRDRRNKSRKGAELMHASHATSLEQLEQRLLLTTLQGGESFIYYNSQQEAVRIEVSVAEGEDESLAQIELLAYDSAWGGLTDLVGFYGYDPSDVDNVVNWSDGDGNTQDIIKIEDNDGDLTYSWQELDADEGLRGAETELYAIYVASATEGTIITITTLASADIPEDSADWYDWSYDISPWTEDTPIIDISGDSTLTAADSSGGVIVGAKLESVDWDSGEVTFKAVATNELTAADRVIGVFPGGSIAGGITIASSEDFKDTGVEAGSDIQSIAINSNSVIYMANLGLNGNIVNVDLDGVLGQDVDALASDDEGTFYSVDNTYLGDTVSSESLGTNVQCVATDGSGIYYAVDEATHTLVMLDSATDEVTTIGTLLDTNVDQFRYDGIYSLTYYNGVLYAIATEVTDLDTGSSPDAPTDAPFLITISTTTGRVLTRNPITDVEEEGDFSSIAISEDGVIYAVQNVEGGDYLYTLAADGTATEVGCLTTQGVSGISGFSGLSFIGETLYGVTGNLLYMINLDEINSTIIDEEEFVYVPCDAVSYPGFSTLMTALTYGVNDLGAFYTVVNSGSDYYLARVPLSSRMAITDSDGVVQETVSLIDSTYSDWAWRNIYAMDYDSDSETMYAIATPFALDIKNVEAHPEEYLAWLNYFTFEELQQILSGSLIPRMLVEIDMETGEVSAIAQISGLGSDDGEIQSFAFDSAGVLYAVAGDTNNVYTIDTSTGVCTYVITLEIPSEDEGEATFEQIVGLEFVTIGSSELLFANTSEALYTFDLTTGEGTLIVQTTFTTLTSLTFDESQSGILWSTADVSGYRLTAINLYSSLLEYDPNAEPSLGMDVNSLTIQELVDMGIITADDVGGSVALMLIGGMTVQDAIDDGYITQEEVDQFVADYIASLPEDEQPVNEVVEVGLLVDSEEPAYSYIDIFGLEFDSEGVLYGFASVMCLDPSVTPLDDSGPYIITIDTETGIVTRGALLQGLEDNDVLGSLTQNPETGEWYAIVRQYEEDEDTGELVEVSDVLVSIDLETGEITEIGEVVVSGENIVGITGIDFQYDSDKAVYVLYAVTSDMMYSLSTVTGKGKFLRQMSPDLPIDMSGLAADDTVEGKYWATAKIGDQYYLVLKEELDPVDLDKIIVGGTVAGQIQTDASINLIEMGFIWCQVNVGMNLDTLIIRQGGGAEYFNDDIGFVMPSAWDRITNEDSAGSVITVGATLGGVYTIGGTLYSAIQTEGDFTIENPSSDFTELEYTDSDDAYDSDWLAGDLVDFTNDTMDTAQFVSHPTGDYTLTGELNEYDSGEDWYAISLLAGQTFTLSGGLLSCAVEFYDAYGNYIDSFGYETEEDAGNGSRGETLEDMVYTALAAGVYYLRVIDTGVVDGYYQLDFTDATAASLGGVRVVGDYGGSIQGDRVCYAATGTGLGANYNITAKGGGNIGAVIVSDTSFSTSVYTADGGDIIAFQAGQLGEVNDSTYYGKNYIISDGNVGSVVALLDMMNATITAGYGGATGILDTDAFIQNIYVAGDYTYNNTISATGSIGVIEVKGDWAAGSGGNIDVLINSDDSDNASDTDATLDLLDVGGNFYALGTIYHGTGGDIGYVNVGGDIYLNTGVYAGPVEPTEYSDGRSVTLTDDSGGRITVNPLTTAVLDDEGNLTYDDDGNVVYFTPTYSYVYLPIDDSLGGVGGVIVNFTIDGSVSFTTTGDAQISYLELTGDDAKVTFKGSGVTDIYYVTAGDVASLTTTGDIVSGTFTSIDKLDVGGNIGSEAGNVDAWLYGHEDAPSVSDTTTEVAYGWFHNKINGINVTGDLTTVTVDGSLQDLRVTGELGTVVVDADNFTAAGDWDGICGVVWSGTRIGTIDVGDGLADDGSASRAMAGIFSTGSIRKVSIDGPYYEDDGVVYGQIDGSIIALSNEIIDDKEVEAIELVVGTGGARLTAIVAAATLDTFQVFDGSILVTGGIDEVNFSGEGAWITGSEIAAVYIVKVTVGKNTLGMTNTYIVANGSYDNKLCIGQVTAGGAGFDNVYITANGGNIGTVKTLDSEGDMIECTFVSTDGINYIAARYILDSGIHATGTVKKIYSTADIIGTTASVGAITTLTVKGNFDTNSFCIAGELGSMTVGGDFSGSYLALQGPSTGYLKSLVVTGDISGIIEAAGKIGKIISKEGSISADIRTTSNEWSGDIALIQTAGGYTGNLDVAGDLKKFISEADLGTSPVDLEEGEDTQTFNVVGDLDYIKVEGDLFAKINVGGDLGKLDVEGTYYSTMYVNGNVTTFMVDGGLGGVLDGENYGELYVYGTIKTLKFNTTSDLVADLTVGGTIKKISLKGGDLIGNLTSLYGSITSISIKDGSILGDLEAVSIGKISVKNGDITGDITATEGDIKSITLVGDLDADVTAAASLDKLTVTGNVVDGNTIAAADIGKMTVKNGDLSADVLSEGAIDSLSVSNGNIDGAVIDAELEIGKIKVSKGDIVDSIIRSGGELGSVDVVNMTDSLISTGWNIGTIKVREDMTDSEVLAGYDVGADGVLGGDDDVMHSANIDKLYITGLMDNSVVEAGIDPGDDDDFRELDDNTDIDGVSSIYTVKIGAVANDSAILADTYIDDNAPAAAVVAPKNTQMPAVGTDFGPETGNNTLVIGGLTFTLTGAGVATYDADTNTLVLNNTTTKSKLTIVNEGLDVEITIIGSEDSQLASLTTKGNVTLGDVSIFGEVKKLSADTIAAGSVWELLGGVSSGKVGDLVNVDLTTGYLKSWKMESMTGGSLTADAIKSLTSSEEVTGDIEATLGDAGKISLRDGDLDGNLTSKGSISSLKVDGNIDGDILVTNADLGTISAGGDMTGITDIAGEVKSVKLKGDFTGSFRSGEGIGSFASDGFSGLLSTDGDIKKVSVKDDMSGLLRSGGSIKSASFGSMTEAIVTASNDLTKLTVKGDMLDSWVFAGIDLGDAGYSTEDSDIDGVVDGETGNIAIDAFAGTLNGLQVDAEYGGTIKSVTIKGNMVDSTISAGVGTGEDGYVGTTDDQVRGTGYIGKVKVSGMIYGSIESCGVFAANEMPTVYHWSRDLFQSNGSAYVGSMESAAGLLTVTSVVVGDNEVTIYFNHAVDSSTIYTEYLTGEAGTLTILLSDDGDYEANGIDITALIEHTLTYDAENYSITFTLSDGETWESLPVSEQAYYQITLDANVIADNRGVQLDGNYDGEFPSGDGEPGGDFVYEFSIAENVLEDVPGYSWWFGCSPTAVGMIIGYYDNTLDDEFVAGDASDQAGNPAVNEMIASSGDGVYIDGSVEVVPATPGTGNIGDYQLYDGYNDYGELAPYFDLSSLDPDAAHENDCLADFMGTGQSVYGLTMGSTYVYGETITEYVEYVSESMTNNYTAETTSMAWGVFTWDVMVAEIDAGRPILISVDADGDGSTDHSSVLIGYNASTHEYACHNTWIQDDPDTEEDESLVWYDFTGVTVGQEFGIGRAVLIEIVQVG